LSFDDAKVDIIFESASVLSKKFQMFFLNFSPRFYNILSPRLLHLPIFAWIFMHYEFSSSDAASVKVLAK